MNSELLKNIIAELSRSEKMYSMAAAHVNESLIAGELKQVAEERHVFARELLDEVPGYEEELDKSKPKDQPDFMEQMKLLLTDVFVQRNVPRILHICSRADQALLESYGNYLEVAEADNVLSEPVRRQYNSLITQQHNFRKRISKYPWFTGT